MDDMKYRLSEVPQDFRDEFPDGFAILDIARVLGNDFMEITKLHTVDHAIKAVVGSLFTRLYNLLLSATILAEEGYGIEEGVITRGVLEIYLDIAYIANQSSNIDEADGLARRFISYQYVTKFLSVKNANEAGMSLPRGAYQLAEKERQEHWDSNYGWGKDAYPLDWTGKRPEDKAKAGGPDALSVYQWLNHHFSRMVHGSWDALTHQIIEEEEEDRLTYIIGPQSTLLELPMPALGLLFGQTIQIMGKLLGINEIEAKAEQSLIEMKLKLRTVNQDTARSAN